MPGRAGPPPRPSWGLGSLVFSSHTAEASGLPCKHWVSSAVSPQEEDMLGLRL